jgi:hypothetical protein
MTPRNTDGRDKRIDRIGERYVCRYVFPSKLFYQTACHAKRIDRMQEVIRSIRSIRLPIGLDLSILFYQSNFSHSNPIAPQALHTIDTFGILPKNNIAVFKQVGAKRIDRIG